MRTLPICTKRGYSSREQAKAAHRLCGWRFRLYECPVCPWGKRWHCTANEKREHHWKKEESF